MVQITNLPAGAEVNDLAGDGISGIADDQLAVGTGAGTAAYYTLPDGAVAYDTTGGTFSQASSSDLSDGPFVNGDADAIHDNVSGEIALVAEKVAVVGDDLILIEDSEATNAKKSVKISNLPAGGEVNDLEGDGASGIADNEIPVGTGAGTVSYQALSDGAVAYDTGTGTFSQASSADLSDGPFLTSPVAIADGGTGQTGQTAAFDALAPTSAAGDLIVHNGTDNVRLPVGATNTWILTVNDGVA